jgi:hypothetical protein
LPQLPTLDDFTGLRIQHRNLLEARMEIASYSQHARLLSFQFLVSYRYQLYSVGGSRRRYLIKNQIAAECCGHALGIAYGLTETFITPVVQQH